MSLPALRDLDVTPVERNGETLICLYDPEGFVEEQMLLSPAAFFVASCLDGKNDVVDIQAAFARQSGGTILPSDDLREVVNRLDEQGFLVTERFFAIRKRTEEAFAQAPVREAYGAGKSYPSDPAELREFLESFFVAENGPGEAPCEPGNGPPARGLVVPHIDYQRGGHVYAHGYLGLHRRGKPKTAFIFGVAHMGAEAPFVLTRKDFETPLGVVKTNQEAIDQLEEACAWDPYEHEFVHRTEHSIEFQAIMLAYLYGTNVRIVPILCGQFSEDPLMKEPESLEDLAAFLAACRGIAADLDNRVTVVAAADLAHVGRRFGDSYDIDASILRRVRSRDEEDLAHVTAVAPGQFYHSVMKDLNLRRVCGLGCIYATLKTIEGSAESGDLLCYDSAPDPLGGIVSFASILLP